MPTTTVKGVKVNGDSYLIDYNSLANKPSIPEAQIQADWNQTDTTATDYIKNKPTIPSGQVQADWNQTDTTATDYIKNKPTVPSGQVQADWNQTDTTATDYIKNKPLIWAGSGSYAIAENYSTIASGVAAHAEGQYATASGDCSHAEGYSTRASGEYAHAEGYHTEAPGNEAHAEGYYARAQGVQSHAEGFISTASGGAAHAEGIYTAATGRASHAEGHSTDAAYRSQHVFGEFNIRDEAGTDHDFRGNYVEIVGNGYFDNGEHRSNARTLDWNGNEWLAGSLTLGSNTLTSVNLGRILDILDDVDSLKAQVADLQARVTALEHGDTPASGTLVVDGTVTDGRLDISNASVENGVLVVASGSSGIVPEIDGSITNGVLSVNGTVENGTLNA